MGEFRPRIVVFACNWCSYAGADLAGVSRMQYPPTTRVIRVMCSGRVTPGFILESFRQGADGVLVTGCHPGDCHYISGNEKALATVERTKRLLHLLGLETDRLRLEWISAAEGARFARVMTQFTEQVRALGPSPLTEHATRSTQYATRDTPHHR
ncbi:MAG TPA: hydrogenase iron-sulfur subunit [Anaerolineales bacterium]|nr:hydrogenase iron-sulfur subunit [Anaerolineae bacterium]HIQ02743.1 hydrogenase iron-sulfur subunit [Anaerolineales bacterium]